MVDESQIQSIYKWYKEAMRTVAKRKVSWPKAKDHKKTYLYMWIKKFANWADQNDLDDSMIRDVIFAIVDYAKRRKILFKGAAILQHERIYNIVLDELERRTDKTESDIYRIKNAEAQFKSKDRSSRVEFLLSRKGIGEYPTIIELYNSGVLPDIYIAVSKSCRKAIRKLTPEMRSILPENVDLFRLQQRIDLDGNKSSVIRRILGDDYLK